MATPYCKYSGSVQVFSVTNASRRAVPVNALMWGVQHRRSNLKDLGLAAKAHTAALSCRGRKVIKRQPLAIEDAAVGGVPTHCFASRANRSSRSLAVVGELPVP